MGLQVRVKHSLGSRLIELPDRTIDNPINVGRAAGAEVQVPSVSVAAKHCVLFRYEGRWAVQDVQAAAGTGTSGTYVNGQQVVDPVMLQIGDVISVGSGASAPTIEVDPAAAAEGRSGWAGDEMTAAPMVPGYAAPAAYATPKSYAGAPGYVSTTGGAGAYSRPAPRRAVAAPAPTGWEGHGEGGNGDHIDLSAAAAAVSTPYSPSYRRKKQRNSPVALMIGAAVSIAIVSLAAWWVISHQQPPQVVVVPQKPKVDDAHHPNNNFDVPGSAAPGEVAPPPRPSVTPRPAASPDDGSAPDASADSSPKAVPPPAKPVAAPQQIASAVTPGPGGMTPPGKTTPTAPPGPVDEWQQMQDLYGSQGDPALAIFRFSDFQKHHTGQHADDLQKFIDDKFDRLWWDRIAQLFQKVDRLGKDAKDKQDLIFDETDKDMKKKEQDELAKLKADQKTTKEMISVKMGYSSDQPPPSSSADLAALREKRDNAKYTEWKRTTLNAIIANKGTTDWAADR